MNNSLRKSCLRAVVALFLATTWAVCSAQTYITPSNTDWAFTTEAGTGSGQFVLGPGTPPSGSPGSAEFTVANPGGELFYTLQYGGIAISNLAGMQYNTFVNSSAIPETVSFEFDFDPGVAPPDPTHPYQGRAVFTPHLVPGAVSVGSWQSWDPKTLRAWWGSGDPTQRLLAAACPISSPCTWSEVIAAFPAGKTLAGGAFGFKLGNSNSAADVSVDGFKLGTAGTSGPIVQYYFSPVSAPNPPATIVVPVPALSGWALTLLAALAGITGLASLRKRKHAA